MPGRTLPTTLSAFTFQVVGDFVRRVASFFDDPIASVQIEFGAYDAGMLARRIKLTVIDRNTTQYAPTLFRNKVGKSPGRWVVWVYGSATEYGAAIPLTPAMVTGTLLSTLPGDIYFMMTDYRGIIEFDGVKAGPADGWVHTGVSGLLRSGGIGWATGASPDPSTEAGDPTISP